MTDRLKRFGLADEIAQCFKRSPFAVQKESFYSPKGVLLQCKTSPFGKHKNSRCCISLILLLKEADSLAIKGYFFLPGGVFRLLK